MAPRRRADGTLVFAGFPEFRPNVSPEEMFRAGVFGGTYFRPIDSAVTGKRHRGLRGYPAAWWRGLDVAKVVTSPDCDAAVNKYGVTSGSSLRDWEKKGWIVAQDPYGWVQWYCRFFLGRRSADDRRQVDRWLGVAGPALAPRAAGRWRRFLHNRVRAGKDSPRVRQLLLQWAWDPPGRAVPLS